MKEPATVGMFLGLFIACCGFLLFMLTTIARFRSQQRQIDALKNKKHADPFIQALRLVPGDRNDKTTWGRTGMMDCPGCGSEKRLQWGRSSVNGHVRLQCETKGCLTGIT